jgi:hypothetical protein
VKVSAEGSNEGHQRKLEKYSKPFWDSICFFFSSPEKNKRPAIFKPWSSKKEPQLITLLQNNFSIYLVQKELQKKHHYFQRKRNKKLNKEIKLQNESKIERKTSRKKQNKTKGEGPLLVAEKMWETTQHAHRNTNKT